MEKARSKDGTAIGFDRSGSGPAVILVCGGSVDRSSNAGVAALLAKGLTVFNYDRRGRGDSGDTQPYAIRREVEDLAAVIASAGGSAGVYGTSSGAALALEAAASGLPITKLALWEPPFILAGTRPLPPANQAAHYRELVAAGRRGDALEFFMVKVVGMPPEFAAQMRSSPYWAVGEGLAHTLAYDAEIMGDYSVPTKRAAAVKARTLVLDGGASPDWLHQSADSLAKAIPSAKRRTLEGQDHNVAPDVVAPALTEFFKS
jgi:pimeloyl-ACP methyl ester carboxylesterase